MTYRVDPLLDQEYLNGGFLSGDYRSGIAVDIMFPGTRDLYNLDPIFDVTAYADRQPVPTGIVVDDSALPESVPAEPEPPLIYTTATTTPQTPTAGAVSPALSSLMPLLVLVAVIVVMKQ